MNQGMGIEVASDGRLVRVRVMVGEPPEPAATVFLTPIQARELARMVRNAADFTAAMEPAQGSV